MTNVECRMNVVMLSEAKHLNRENRPFASLSVTAVAFRVTMITPVSFRAPHLQFIVS